MTADLAETKGLGSYNRKKEYIPHMKGVSIDQLVIVIINKRNIYSWPKGNSIVYQSKILINRLNSVSLAWR